MLRRFCHYKNVTGKNLVLKKFTFTVAAVKFFDSQCNLASNVICSEILVLIFWYLELCSYRK